MKIIKKKKKNYETIPRGILAETRCTLFASRSSSSARMLRIRSRVPAKIGLSFAALDVFSPPIGAPRDLQSSQASQFPKSWTSRTYYIQHTLTSNVNERRRILSSQFINSLSIACNYRITARQSVNDPSR
ncbi:hypothetical protein PUN28_012017 [Cardiocondyla obscurior]|uniref:Uncharacterized protein n=1 Tax=Cardiocondyla obscurior TaxID=286306 RepID=A0AAW2FA57_9HYME